jgi:hypothetical protein
MVEKADDCEVEQENQTLGKRDFSLPSKMANVELVLRHHEDRRRPLSPTSRNKLPPSE